MKRGLVIAGIYLVIVVVLFARTALDIALTGSASDGRVRSVEFLLAIGADPNTRHWDKGGALLDAVYKNRTDTVKQLLQSGADPNLMNSPGDPTPLMVATEFGNHSAMKYLIAAGANVWDTDEGCETAMDYANDNKDATAKQILAAAIKISPNSISALCKGR